MVYMTLIYLTNVLWLLFWSLFLPFLLEINLFMASPDYNLQFLAAHSCEYYILGMNWRRSYNIFLNLFDKVHTPLFCAFANAAIHSIGGVTTY
jgi:hypothetical protein